jgi:hypothetical protein
LDDIVDDADDFVLQNGVRIADEIRHSMMTQGRTRRREQDDEMGTVLYPSANVDTNTEVGAGVRQPPVMSEGVQPTHRVSSTPIMQGRARRTLPPSCGGLLTCTASCNSGSTPGGAALKGNHQLQEECEAQVASWLQLAPGADGPRDRQRSREDDGKDDLRPPARAALTDERVAVPIQSRKPDERSVVAHPSYRKHRQSVQPTNFGAAGEREGTPGEGCRIAKRDRKSVV